MFRLAGRIVGHRPKEKRKFIELWEKMSFYAINTWESARNWRNFHTRTPCLPRWRAQTGSHTRTKAQTVNILCYNMEISCSNVCMHIGSSRFPPNKYEWTRFMIAFDGVVRHGCWLIKINIKRASLSVHSRELDAIAHLQAFQHHRESEALSPRSMTFQDCSRFGGTQMLDGHTRKRQAS